MASMSRAEARAAAELYSSIIDPDYFFRPEQLPYAFRAMQFIENRRDVVGTAAGAGVVV